MQGLSIQLLGRPRIERDGVAVSASLPVKGQAMLFYVCAQRRSLSRGSLAALLWGETGSSKARANLRLTLTRLRRVLGDALDLDGDEIAVSPDVSVDLYGFDALAARLDDATIEELDAVATQLRGEFLEGFALADAGAFEEWVDGERLRTRRAACRLWQRLGALREAVGDAEGALQAARERIRLEPWDEAAHEELMERLATQGRPWAAIAQFEALRRTLAEELGARPGEKLEALHRRLLADTPTGGAIAHRPPAIDADTAGTPALIGRQADLDAIERDLADRDCRSLVLLGPGGIGKTMLARGVAALVADRFRDGAAIVSLADTTAASASEAEERVVGAIAQALGLALPGPTPARQALPESLAERELLLVLDNAESARGATPWLSELLGRAPHVKLLLTSRQTVPIAGTWLRDVGGLDDSAAAALFARCARRVCTHFDVKAQQADVSRICRLVGGSPLAIELAARRVHVLSCADLARHLGESIDLLDDAAAPARHRSVRVVLDESWQGLDDGLRAAACRLSVFDGAFDAEAAEAIAQVGALGLSRLAEHCWLGRGGEGRFSMHPLVRRYAREQTVAREAGAHTLQAAHAQHYLARYAKQAAALAQDPAPEVLARADADVDELRAALAWALERAPTPMLAELVDAAWPYLQRKGWIDEFESAMTQATARRDVDAEACARWRACLGHGRFVEGRATEAAETGSRALSGFGEPLSRFAPAWYAHSIVAPIRYARARRRLGDDAFRRRARHVIDSICYVGELSHIGGEPHKSLALCLRGLALLRHAGPCAEGACLLGAAAYMTSVLRADRISRRFAQRAMAIGSAAGSPLARAHALSMTSLARITRGEWDGMDEALAEAIDLYRALGQPRWTMEACSFRGKALYLQGRLDESRRAFETLDAEARHGGDALGRHWATLGLVECGLRAGDVTPAAALAMLDDVRRFATRIEYSDPAEIIRQHGLTAVFRVRAGQRAGASEAASLAAALIGRTRLCGFWSLEGYSGAIEAMVSLAGDEPQWLGHARASARRFARLARHFPILRPRATWAAALVRTSGGGTKPASDGLARASRLAERWHVGLDAMLLAQA
ncbi:MAG TPA: BTAD domain-containing putative transcriptional regulator [Zeimonas sp.]